MRVVLNQMSAVGNRTGVGYYADRLLAALRQLGADDTEFFDYPPRWLRETKALCHRLSSRPVGPQRIGPEVQRKLRGRLRHYGQRLLAGYFRVYCGVRRPDVYHEPNYLPLLSELPTVATVHDLSVLVHPEWHPRDRVAFFERQFLKALAQCRHLVAGSDFTRQEMLRHLGVAPERITRVYYGMRSELRPLAQEQVAPILRRLGLPPRYLLYVGTIEPRKNLLVVLKAYCSLPDAVRSEWPLVLVGSWGWNFEAEWDYWQREARHRGVRHLGYAADKHLSAIYNGARALVYPSFYEGFGLPPLEMMACGGAVLASTAGAVTEVVGSHAHLIAPRDLDGWRDALLAVVSGDDWWQTLRRGVVAWSRQFTWRRCATETLAVYRLACGLGNVSAAKAA